MIIQPDAIAHIQFFKTENGGRQGATPSDRFSCIIRIAGRLHDCRFLLDKIGPVSPGVSINDVPIKFLNSESALEGVSEKDEFEILERGIIGKGKIIKIMK